jgi:hypothetical protein
VGLKPVPSGTGFFVLWSMIEGKSDEELLQLAKDIYSGAVYTDRHLEDIKNLRICFSPLATMPKEELDKFSDVGLFYEYISESPSKLGDMPIFLSVQVINRDDAKVVVDLIKARMAEAAAPPTNLTEVDFNSL